MPARPADHPILKHFRAALNEFYGERAVRVILFGSRVRGDAEEDSDYDVAVFLCDMTNRAAEMNRLADLSNEQAQQAIETANRFIVCIETLLKNPAV